MADDKMENLMINDEATRLNVTTVSGQSENILEDLKTKNILKYSRLERKCNELTFNLSGGKKKIESNLGEHRSRLIPSVP